MPSMINTLFQCYVKHCWDSMFTTPDLSSIAYQCLCNLGRRVVLQEWMLILYGTTEDPDNHELPSPALLTHISRTSTSRPRSFSSSTTSTIRTTPTSFPPPDMAFEADPGDNVLDNSVLHSGLQIDHSSKQSLQNGAGKHLFTNLSCCQTSLKLNKYVCGIIRKTGKEI